MNTFKLVFVSILIALYSSSAFAIEKEAEGIPQGSMLIWDGESDNKDMNKFRHGEINTTEAFKGNGCFAAERGVGIIEIEIGIAIGIEEIWGLDTRNWMSIVFR
jgi:hypothetical protein